MHLGLISNNMGLHLLLASCLVIHEVRWGVKLRLNSSAALSACYITGVLGGGESPSAPFVYAKVSILHACKHEHVWGYSLQLRATMTYNQEFVSCYKPERLGQFKWISHSNKFIFVYCRLSLFQCRYTTRFIVQLKNKLRKRSCEDLRWRSNTKVPLPPLFLSFGIIWTACWRPKVFDGTLDKWGNQVAHSSSPVPVAP